jgi:hypothetical protein
MLVNGYKGGFTDPDSAGVVADPTVPWNPNGGGAGFNLAGAVEGDTIYYDATTGVWKKNSTLSIDDTNNIVVITNSSSDPDPDTSYPQLIIRNNYNFGTNNSIAKVTFETPNVTGLTDDQVFAITVEADDDGAQDYSLMRFSAYDSTVMQISSKGPGAVIYSDAYRDGDAGSRSSTMWLSRVSSGVGAGQYLSFQDQIGVGSSFFAAHIGTDLTDATTGSENADFLVILANNGSADIDSVSPQLRLTSDGNLTVTGAFSAGSLAVDNRVYYDSATLTTSATTANQVADTWSATTYRTVKYTISITSGSNYHSVEMLVTHNGTTAYQTTFADLYTNTSLSTFAVDISGGNVRLLVTPANAVTTYMISKTLIIA